MKTPPIVSPEEWRVERGKARAAGPGGGSRRGNDRGPRGVWFRWRSRRRLAGFTIAGKDPRGRQHAREDDGRRQGFSAVHWLQTSSKRFVLEKTRRT